MAPTSFLDVLEIILVSISYLIVRFLKNNNGLPLNWPLLGMLPDFFLNINRTHDRCTEVLDRSGCTFLFKGLWFTSSDLLETVDPANIHYIMSRNFKNFPKGPKFSKIFELLGDGIFNTDHESWTNQRKIARALINHQRFHEFLLSTVQDKVHKGMLPIIEHVSAQNLVVDLQDLFQRFTLDSTCILVTGYDPRSLSLELPAVPFSRAMDEAEEAILYRHIIPESLWKLQQWLNIGPERKLSEALQVLDDTIAKYISMKRQEMSVRKDRKYGSFDLLTSYMTSEDSDTEVNLKTDDDKFLRDTILNFMIAGRDTTSSALTWFFWLVSRNPAVIFKIREELKTIVPSTNDQDWPHFDIQDLNKLVYLHGALCETLRLYPPVPFQHKAPHEPDVLPSGHHVDPKMTILFPLYAMGRMSYIWGKDCLEFKPERWISERGGIKHEPSYKFLAFNAGPRTCLGKEVAFTQIKMVAAAIIHNYDVQVVEEHPVRPCLSIILHMKNGLMVKITKRSGAPM